jgi:hypothetical protein
VIFLTELMLLGSPMVIHGEELLIQRLARRPQIEGRFAAIRSNLETGSPLCTAQCELMEALTLIWIQKSFDRLGIDRQIHQLPHTCYLKQSKNQRITVAISRVLNKIRSSALPSTRLSVQMATQGGTR